MKLHLQNINIADMTNKSRDEIAINLIDIDEEPSQNLITKLQDIDHVLSVTNLQLNRRSEFLQLA